MELSGINSSLLLLKVCSLMQMTLTVETNDCLIPFTKKVNIPRECHNTSRNTVYLRHHMKKRWRQKWQKQSHTWKIDAWTKKNCNRWTALEQLQDLCEAKRAMLSFIIGLTNMYTVCRRKQMLKLLFCNEWLSFKIVPKIMFCQQSV